MANTETYASLSASDKAIVQNGSNMMRAAIGELARQWNHVKAIQDDTNLLAIVNSLIVTEVIPNTSGLAGADDLTQAELVNLYTVMTGIKATNDNASFRAQASKAAGINALLG